MTWEAAGTIAWAILLAAGSVGVYFVLAGLIAYLLGLTKDQADDRSPWNRW